MLDPAIVSASLSAQLCIRGAEEELRGDHRAARGSYGEAWAVAESVLDRCIAAHYVGHGATDLHEQLEWHTKAMAFAMQCPPSDVADFFPSLHACLGRTLRKLGREADAMAHEDRARKLGFRV